MGSLTTALSVLVTVVAGLVYAASAIMSVEDFGGYEPRQMYHKKHNDYPPHNKGDFHLQTVIQPTTPSFYYIDRRYDAKPREYYESYKAPVILPPKQNFNIHSGKGINENFRDINYKDTNFRENKENYVNSYGHSKYTDTDYKENSFMGPNHNSQRDVNGHYTNTNREPNYRNNNFRDSHYNFKDDDIKSGNKNYETDAQSYKTQTHIINKNTYPMYVHQKSYDNTPKRAPQVSYIREGIPLESELSFTLPKSILPEKIKIEGTMERYGKSLPFLNNNDKQQSETKKCYQCAWSPAKTDYITLKRQKVAVASIGGWDKCKGPFTASQAKHYGVDEWECHDNCYLRVDQNGNVFRGCYKGEFGVNPNKLGCHYQADSLYCFCDGESCNHGPAPEHKMYSQI